MSWMNNDGLYIKYGTEEADVAKGGSFNVDGGTHWVEAVVSDFTKLGATAEIIGAEDGGDPRGIMIPKGAFIEKVELVMTAAATSDNSPTLDIGLLKASDRSTELDDDGLVAALAKTSIDADGDIVEFIQGGTSHGALIGTALTENGLLCVAVNLDTTGYTAGAAKVRVYYS